MVMTIPDELAERLRELAAEANLSPEDYLRRLLGVPDSSAQPTQNALLNIAGMFEDDIEDMSTTVSETLKDYFRNKHDRSG